MPNGGPSASRPINQNGRCAECSEEATVDGRCEFHSLRHFVRELAHLVKENTHSTEELRHEIHATLTAPKKPLLSRKLTASEMGVCIRKVDYLIEKRELETTRIGGRVMVRRESLERAIKQPTLGKPRKGAA
jgi:hypothetical protein